MSALYDFKSSVIKIDSIANQIAKGVHELRRQNMPEPFTVQLTQMQFDTLRFECRGFATQFGVEEGNHIHGCKIEVIPTHNAKSEPTARLFAQVGSTDGLCVAVSPAPTFNGERDGH